MSNRYDGFRTFIEQCRAIGELVEIDNADWDLEIGTLTEASSEHLAVPPMLLFDNIKGYPKGYRVASLPLGSPKRVALIVGVPHDRPKLELVRLMSRKIRDVKPLPPVEMKTGPVMENVLTGDTVDLLRFPA